MPLSAVQTQTQPRIERRRRAGLLGLMLALAWGGSALAAEAAVVNVPGTRVSLAPPAGFELSRDFAGFVDKASGASIVVTEMPAEAYAGVAEAFAPGTRYRGMAIAAREPTRVAGHQAVLIEAVQETADLEYRKWVLIFGTTDFTGMIAVNAPQGPEAPDLREGALAALASTEVLQAARSDPRDSLPYRFQEAGGFALQRVLQGNAASLAKPGDPDALFVITAPPVEACAQLEAGAQPLARALLAGVADIELISVLWSTEIAVDGLAGTEIRAEGRDRESGRRKLLYQTLLVDGCRYYRFLGTAPLAQASAYLEGFQAMTRSFARRR